METEGKEYWATLVALMEIIKACGCEREVYKVDGIGYFWFETDEPVRFSDFGGFGKKEEVGDE